MYILRTLLDDISTEIHTHTHANVWHLTWSLCCLEVTHRQQRGVKIEMKWIIHCDKGFNVPSLYLPFTDSSWALRNHLKFIDYKSFFTASENFLFIVSFSLWWISLRSSFYRLPVSVGVGGWDSIDCSLSFWHSKNVKCLFPAHRRLKISLFFWLNLAFAAATVEEEWEMLSIRQ